MSTHQPTRGTPVEKFVTLPVIEPPPRASAPVLAHDGDGGGGGGGGAGSHLFIGSPGGRATRGAPCATPRPSALIARCEIGGCACSTLSNRGRVTRARKR